VRPAETLRFVESPAVPIGKLYAVDLLPMLDMSDELCRVVIPARIHSEGAGEHEVPQNGAVFAIPGTKVETGAKVFSRIIAPFFALGDLAQKKMNLRYSNLILLAFQHG